MSRSTKHYERALVHCSWLDPEPNDQPGTEKAGATRIPDLRPRSSRQSGFIRQRRTYGHTEKILRRNRKLWARLFSKEGRRLDKLAIAEGSTS